MPFISCTFPFVASVWVVLCCLPSTARAGATTLDWQPWVDFGNTSGVALARSLVTGREMHIVGGITNVSGLNMSSADPFAWTVPSPSARSIDPAFPNLWHFSNVLLPFGMQGQFSVQVGCSFFAAPALSNTPFGTPCDRCIFFMDICPGSTKSMAWETATIPSRFPSRRRAAMLVSQDALSIFGGVDASGQYLPEILTYTFASAIWTGIALAAPVPLIDCTIVAVHECNTFFTCSPTGGRIGKIVQYNRCNQTFVRSPYLLPLHIKGELSVTIQGQFAVGLVTWETPTGCDSIFIFFDANLDVLSPVLFGNTNLRCRIGGSLVGCGATLFYAGGIEPATGRLSKAVDMTPFGPQVLASPVDGYTTSPGLIRLHVSPCTPTTRVILATSSSCESAIPGTHDVGCTALPNQRTGTVEFNVETAWPAAYICVFPGSCAVSVGDRQPCLFSSNQDSPASCMTNGCCYDFTAMKCFAYAAAPPSGILVQASPLWPIAIIATPTTSEEPFLQTKLGIAALASSGVVVGLVIVSLLVYFRQQKLAGALVAAPPADGEFCGRYRVLRKLGQGGFGSVFLVESPEGRTLALKQIVCKDEEERNYAVKEFELLYAAQGHPAMIVLEEMLISWHLEPETTSGAAPVVAVPAAAEGSPADASEPSTQLLQASPRCVFIVMEYFAEGDLAGFIEQAYGRHERLSESFILNVVARQVCELLLHLQSRQPPIVHRDLKPENILLRSNASEVVVTDFGLAQAMDRSYMTTRAGTIHYVAPECWKRHYTGTVDMWALGCILYVCCTGRISGRAKRVMFSDARVKGFRRDIARELSGYSSLMRTVVIGLLVTKPEARLTAEQVLGLLDGDSGTAVTSRTPSTFSGGIQ